jgi:ammonium transporter Rh
MIVSNTILSLTGSCLATFIVSGLVRDKFSMDDILNATLAGGVAIGAPSGVVANAGIALLIGLIAGSISTLGYVRLQEILYNNIGLHDTCGVNNLHGIPGLLGGFISAMVVASYQTYPGLDSNYIKYLNFTPNGRTFSGQAGIQVACTFISFGIAIVTGIITGVILYFMYDFKD